MTSLSLKDAAMESIVYLNCSILNSQLANLYEVSPHHVALPGRMSLGLGAFDLEVISPRCFAYVSSGFSWKKSSL